MTKTEYKVALREESMLLASAVAVEDWQVVYECSEKVAQYARLLILEEQQEPHDS